MQKINNQPKSAATDTTTESEYESGYGSEAEWDALGEAAKEAEWEEFSEKNMLGIADEMYFFEVLLERHMVGYVGH